MATLKDLGLTSFLDKSQDEQIEHLRQIRLARREPEKKPVKRKAKGPAKKKELTPEQAKQLLQLLGG